MCMCMYMCVCGCVCGPMYRYMCVCITHTLKRFPSFSATPDGTKLDVVSPEDGYDVIRKMDNGSMCLLSFQEQNGHQEEQQYGYELMIPKCAVVAPSKVTPSSQEARENREVLASLDSNAVRGRREEQGEEEEEGCREYT